MYILKVIFFLKLVVSLAMLLSLARGEYQDSAGSANTIGKGGLRAVRGGAFGGIQGGFIEILKDDRSQTARGDYSFSYESADGTKRHEHGTENNGQNTKGGWR